MGVRVIYLILCIACLANIIGLYLLSHGFIRPAQFLNLHNILRHGSTNADDNDFQSPNQPEGRTEVNDNVRDTRSRGVPQSLETNKDQIKSVLRDQVNESHTARFRSSNPSQIEMNDFKTATNVMEWEFDVNEAEEAERLKSSPYIYNEEKGKEKMKRFKRFRPSLKNHTRYIGNCARGTDKKLRFSSFKDCLYSNCVVTEDFTKADLLFFMYVRNIKEAVDKIPKHKRPKHQRWLVHQLDPLYERPELLHLASMFDWTYSYMQNSDFPIQFGVLQKRKAQFKPDYDAMFIKKTRLAAWIVSHCKTPSKREVYVNRMATMMDVDIFGSCGNITCGSKSNYYSLQCLDHYKFYLSFENNFCRDYVTEKFFKLFARKKPVSVIPVVRGAFDYKRFLPRGIYVDAADFKSPEDLARYLVELGNDKARYNNMLRRVHRWQESPTERLKCRLCELLNTHFNDPYKDETMLHKYLSGSISTCHQPLDL